MARDWSEERWIKVFLCDSVTWVSLSVHARGVYVLLQRVADRTGAIELGAAGMRGIGALLHAKWDDIAPCVAELVEAGYVVERDGAIVLPEHIEQQNSRSSDAARQRESRRKKRQDTPSRDVTRRHAASRDVTPSHGPSQDVTIRGEEIRREDKREEESRADTRARAKAAAAAPIVDPKARRIALELAANAKFACLDATSVASELLGALGPLGFALTDAGIDQAIAQAAAEAETGAPERRLRQVLTWKLKDAATGGKRGHHPPQGVDEKLAEDVARTMARVERDRLEREARPPIPEEFQL